MKKYVLLLVIAISIMGCSLGDDDKQKFHLELLPVESATFPAQFVKDEIYEIPIQYHRPTTCHVFEGFYYERNANVRTIAIQTSVLERNDCTPATVNPITEKLKFIPTTESSYIFKLWKGKDANGADIFDEIEVPVVVP